MADLQIESQPREFVGQQVSFPQSSPVSEQIQRSAEQTKETLGKAAELLVAINRQKQAQTSADAIAFFRQKELSLLQQVNTVRDPDTRRSLYQEGSNSLFDETKKQFPGLSQISQDHLSDLMVAKQHAFYISSVTNQMRQQQKDMVDYVKRQTLAAAHAPSGKDREEIMGETLQHIDQAAGNGIISKEHADYLTTNLINQVGLQRANDDLLQGIQGDPAKLQKIMQLKPGDPEYKLTSAQVITLREKALHAQNQQLTLGHQQWQQIVDQKTRQSIEDPGRYAELNAPYTGRNLANAVQGYGVSSPSATEAMIRHFGMITDKDQLQQEKQNWLSDAHKWSPDDVKQINAAIAADERNLNTDFGAQAVSYKNQLALHLSSLNPYAILGKRADMILQAKGVPTKNKEILDNFEYKAKTARNEKELDEAFRAAISEADGWYATNLPKPKPPTTAPSGTATPKAAATVKPRTAPTPAATPTPEMRAMPTAEPTETPEMSAEPGATPTFNPSNPAEKPIVPDKLGGTSSVDPNTGTTTAGMDITSGGD